MDITKTSPSIGNAELENVLKALLYRPEPIDVSCSRCKAEPDSPCVWPSRGKVAEYHVPRIDRANRIFAREWWWELVDELDKHDIDIRKFVADEVKSIFNRKDQKIR